jgi:hypothetical protein
LLLVELLLLSICLSVVVLAVARTEVVVVVLAVYARDRALSEKLHTM